MKIEVSPCDRGDALNPFPLRDPFCDPASAAGLIAGKHKIGAGMFHIDNGFMGMKKLSRMVQRQPLRFKSA